MFRLILSILSLDHIEMKEGNPTLWYSPVVLNFIQPHLAWLDWQIIYQEIQRAQDYGKQLQYLILQTN